MMLPVLSRLRVLSGCAVFLPVFLLVLLLPQAHLSAQTNCRYESLAQAHPDGIAKRYCGRQISRVMGWQGASWLDRPEREQEERTDLMVERLGLRPGQVVADVGAGTGRLSLQMLKRVEPAGSVWAVDVQPEMVTMLESAARKEGSGRLKVRQSTATESRLPDNSIDLAVMVDVYHELEFPLEMLQSISRAVKPDGRIVFVEYRANDPAVPIKPLHTMSVEQIRREAEAIGLIFEKVDSRLPWQHMVFFKRP